jgi:hypothetical protein
MPIQKITSGIIQDGAVAAADIVSVANTAITGNIVSSQIAPNATLYGNTIISSTGSLTIPSGTTAQRPSSATDGMIRYNSTTLSFEAYLNGNWVTVKQAPIFASYALVAGGGGGSPSGPNIMAGGGGAGGYLSGTATLVSGTTYTVTIGGGGSEGAVGNPSTIAGSGLSTITATAGGYGARQGHSSPTSAGGPGGSGGGGSTPGGTAGSGTPGQGFNGGAGGGEGGGGGGGAGAVGQTGDRNPANSPAPNYGGNGGIGVTVGLTSPSVLVAGGGGGGAAGGTYGNYPAPNNPAPTTGKAYGGGEGYNTSGSPAPLMAGTTNTGGGGGGAGSYSGTTGNGGTGGSGVAFVSIPTSLYTGTYSPSPAVTVTTNGANTVLKFTGTATYTA